MRPDVLEVTGPARVRGGALWIAALAPLVLLGALLALLAWRGPADALRGDGYPPVERLTFERVVLGADGIAVTVMNDGPDPVTIAQVQVDEAYWQFTAASGTAIPHLGRTTLSIPYPWVAGESHALRLVTSTGVTFDYVIPVAVETPRPGVRFFVVFTLIGIYVGVLPVAIGLLWYPLVASIGRRALEFLLALTLGLLVFLLVDSAHEGFEIANGLPDSFQGAALFLFAVVGAYMALEALGSWLRHAKGGVRENGWVMALLIAVGIGLHNFAEGLAIGAAFALGEAALGTLLVIGFTLHNTTEGLAIVAPLARERPNLRRLIVLGIIGGVPTIAGAWLGGFVYAPIWSVLFLAVGAGAIAQVVVQIGRQMAAGEPPTRYFATAHVAAGLFVGFGIMYATGLLVG